MKNFDPDTERYTPGISSNRDGASRFLHSGIKNMDAKTASNQTISATRNYDAFGNVLSSTGVWDGFFGYAGGFGYQEEKDTGLKLLGHRYYDSATGRFLSRDPIRDARNDFVYVDNNPLGNIDARGLQLNPEQREIHRQLSKDKALRNVAEKYKNDGAFRRRFHDRIGKLKKKKGPSRDGKYNNDLTGDELRQIGHDLKDDENKGRPSEASGNFPLKWPTFSPVPAPPPGARVPTNHHGGGRPVPPWVVEDTKKMMIITLTVVAAIVIVLAPEASPVVGGAIGRGLAGGGA